MAGCEGARDPTHLPAECFIVLVGVGQVAIGEEDDDHANGQRDQERRKNLPQPARGFRRRGRVFLWTSGNWVVRHGNGSFNCFIGRPSLVFDEGFVIKTILAGRRTQARDAGAGICASDRVCIGSRADAT